jgi:hypothetical protein
MNINNIVKETYINTFNNNRDDELSTFKEKLILKNKNLLKNANRENYYG